MLTKFKLICERCGSDNCEITSDLYDNFGIESTSITIECCSCGATEEH